MTKNIFKMAAIAALVSGGINMAHAASSTTVTVHGSINTITCDVSADKNDVNLGNYLPSDFAAAGAFPAAAGKTQDFTISLNGCQGTPSGSGQASLKLTGPVAAAGTSYFSSDATSQAAIGVAKKDTPSTLLTNGQVIAIGAQGDDATTLSNSELKFTTGLISSVGTNTNTGQQISAPLTFAFVYN